MNDSEQTSPQGQASATFEPPARVTRPLNQIVKLGNPAKNEHFLAWSVFNPRPQPTGVFKRVLEEATDESVPLLERFEVSRSFQQQPRRVFHGPRFRSEGDA